MQQVVVDQIGEKQRPQKASCNVLKREEAAAEATTTSTGERYEVVEKK